VLMNVVVNARDAMPGGGTIVLSTRRSQGSLRGGAAATPCIVVEIRDTGTGMDEATRRRAFEPFFTTKGLGVGTGLGLSTTYGIVHQLGGRIEIESAVGRGTLVRIFIPECAPARVGDALAPPKAPISGVETVLLLEDDAPVRRASSRMLRSLGYAVLEAATPSEALALARDHGGPIHALVTDVVMPETNGVEAARAFQALRPDAAVLFVSGYSADALSDRPGGAPARLLPKPFSRVDLGRAVRDAIAASE